MENFIFCAMVAIGKYVMSYTPIIFNIYLANVETLMNIKNLGTSEMGFRVNGKRNNPT